MQEIGAALTVKERGFFYEVIQMLSEEELSRLRIMLVQIERFVARENYIDAVARARHLVKACEEALVEAPRDGRVAGLLATASERLEELEAEFLERNRALRERRLGELLDAAES